MKKPYQKPSVYVERFELLEHIASCKVGEGITAVNYRDKYTCSYRDDDVSLFLEDGVNGCQIAEIMVLYDYGDESDPIQNFLDSIDPVPGGGCYNAFMDGNIFAS